jgi:hypothetical protein
MRDMLDRISAQLVAVLDETCLASSTERGKVVYEVTSLKTVKNGHLAAAPSYMVATYLGLRGGDHPIKAKAITRSDPIQSPASNCEQQGFILSYWTARSAPTSLID